ncbi:MAG: transcription termination factor NusA [Planctomycetaceae bacterium]|jgi:transcription termination/antitermination protein NusA|nr:transcription termination factor NusA [Planctomycetaceae bacterium]
MNGNELLRIVDVLHRDKNIDKNTVFEGIEQAILSAARKHFGEEEEVAVEIDRDTGEATVTCGGEVLDADVLGDLLGRVSAQTAKQVMIQRIREAERDQLFDEYTELQSQLMTGAVTRLDHGSATVNLGKVEAILPRSEQIPGESHRVGERVRAIILEVRKVGPRVRVVLSRKHPDMVRRLFEIEIPEVGERIIEIRSLAREAGYRSKVAVSCFDTKVDAVGACVGVRGARIRNIVDELAGERIDIVRWNDSLQVLVPNALQPAEVEDVILCPMLGKVIVLVRDDQLSLAIGKKGQNVRLASKLVGWDINVMTQEKLDEMLDGAVTAFCKVPHITEDLAENLVAQGFFSFDDLSVIEPDQLEELSGLSTEDCTVIVDYADEESLKAEQEEIREAAERKLAREMGRMEADTGSNQAKQETTAAPVEATAAPEAPSPEEATDETAVDAEEVEVTEGAVEEEGATEEEVIETAEEPVESEEPTETEKEVEEPVVEVAAEESPTTESDSDEEPTEEKQAAQE